MKEITQLIMVCPLGENFIEANAPFVADKVCPLSERKKSVCPLAENFMKQGKRCMGKCVL